MFGMTMMKSRRMRGGSDCGCSVTLMDRFFPPRLGVDRSETVRGTSLGMSNFAVVHRLVFFVEAILRREMERIPKQNGEIGDIEISINSEHEMLTGRGVQDESCMRNEIENLPRKRLWIRLVQGGNKKAPQIKKLLEMR